MDKLQEGQRVRIIKGAGRWKYGRLDAIWKGPKGLVYFVVLDDGNWYFKRRASELEVTSPGQKKRTRDAADTALRRSNP